MRRLAGPLLRLPAFSGSVPPRYSVQRLGSLCHSDSSLQPKNPLNLDVAVQAYQKTLGSRQEGPGTVTFALSWSRQPAPGQAAVGAANSNGWNLRHYKADDLNLDVAAPAHHNLQNAREFFFSIWHEKYTSSSRYNPAILCSTGTEKAAEAASAEHSMQTSESVQVGTAAGPGNRRSACGRPRFFSASKFFLHKKMFRRLEDGLATLI